MPRYAELQATTNFSFLPGGSHPEELVAQAKALGLDGARRHRPQHARRRRARARRRQGGRPAAHRRRAARSSQRWLPEPPLPADRPRRLWPPLPPALARPDAAPRKASARSISTTSPPMPRARSSSPSPPDGWDWREARCRSRHLTQATPILRRRGRSPFPAPALAAPAARALDPTQRWPRHRAAISHRLADLAASHRGRRSRPRPLYLAAAHSYRGDDRARIAALARARRALPARRSSPPATCSITPPTAARCRTC